MKARIMMLIMAVALVALPAMAQQEWQSTSAMQGSGSTYSSNVTAVGATSAASATTESYSPAKAPGGPRRSGFDDTPHPGTVDPGSPIGDAVLPLMAFAMLFGGVIYMRRKRAAKS